ncbi:MAG: sortase domain-bontaining protein, partial [Gemmiger sp.]
MAKMTAKRKKATMVAVACAAALVAVTAAAVALVAPKKQPSEPAPGADAGSTSSSASLPSSEPGTQAEPAYRRTETADADARREAVELHAKIGRVWVEGTEIDCDLYWSDTGSEFSQGAAAHADDGCVLPGQQGTLFVGAHTNTYFADMESVQTGDIIHVETEWGTYLYRVTDQKQITETDIDACYWGDTTERCILYTCYPFGILT